MDSPIQAPAEMMLPVRLKIDTAGRWTGTSCDDARRSAIVRRLRSMLFTAMALGMISQCRDVPAATIHVGNHFLHPDTAGQRITIRVEGGDAISGLDLFAQVGDGGPELATLPDPLPAGTDGPAITAVDLKTGTVFASTTDVPSNLGSIPQVAIWSLALIGTTPNVTADGVLASLIVDTTGFSSGTWELLLAGVLPALGPLDTTFAGTSADAIVNGSIVLSSQLGDLDFDGDADFDDIESFVLGLSDAAQYASRYGVSPVLRGDFLADEVFDFDDIPGLVASLSAGVRAVPEGRSIVLVLMACGAAAIGRRGGRFAVGALK